MSNDMHSTLSKWLEELGQEIEVIASSDISEEAESNMVSFGCSEELLEDWGKESVTAFIFGCASLYAERCGNTAMVFYAWYDELAGQLRICAVSKAHEKLPFACKQNQTEISAVIAGIFRNESGLYSRDELDVWCKNI